MATPPAAANGPSESVIRKMTRVAMQHGAVNLSQGFPNEPPPLEVRLALARGVLGGTPAQATELESHMAALAEVLRSSEGSRMDTVNQYSIPYGRTELRQAVSEFYQRLYGWTVDPEAQLTITLGATEAMACVLRTIGRPGDKVVVLEPFHELYPSQCSLFYLEPTFVTLRCSEDGDWQLDFIELEEAMKGARLFVLNSPHNPTGKVFTRAELERIAELALKHNVFIITDEIYEFMTYGKEPHHILPQICPSVADRTFLCNSIGKSCSATGWRVGWCISPPAYTSPLRAVHDQMVVMSPQPMQFATETFVRLPESFFRETLKVKYLERLQVLAAGLSAVGFKVNLPDGAYYLFADYKSVPELRELAPMEAAMHLVTTYGVASVPGDNFYRKSSDGERYLRFCACRSLSDIESAIEKLSSLKKSSL